MRSVFELSNLRSSQAARAPGLQLRQKQILALLLTLWLVDAGSRKVELLDLLPTRHQRRYLPRAPTTTKAMPPIKDKVLRIGEIGRVLFSLWET